MRMLSADMVPESKLPLFSDLSKGKLSWDLFIMAFAIITSFLAPSEFVFKKLQTHTTYKNANMVIDGIFLMDVFVNFRTTFINHDGQEVKDQKRISIRYLKGMFIFDFLSSLPLSQFIAASWVKYFKLLKIIRIKKLNSVIQRLEFREEQKAVLKIMKLILVLCLIMHVIGCTWFFLVDSNTDPYERWVPPLDFIYVTRVGYFRFYDMEEVDETYQYLVSVYMVVLGLGGNEMGPRTTVEILVMFGIMLFLILYNATIFGDMTVLVAETSKKEQTFQQQVDVANTAMRNMDLPREAQEEVRDYLIRT